MDLAIGPGTVTTVKRENQEWVKEGEEEFYQCPICGELHHALYGSEKGHGGILYRCRECGRDFRQEDWKTVKRTVVYYRCPKCRNWVADVPENVLTGEPYQLACPDWNCANKGEDGARTQQVVMVDGIHINETSPILHHGLSSGEFKVIHTRTDYFFFRHEPCNEIAEITRVILDDDSRIVFNLKCPKCGFYDAVKTKVFSGTIWSEKNPYERYDKFESERKQRFLISPSYQKCMRRYSWDWGINL